MRYSHQKIVSTLLTTLMLIMNCVSAEPKKKRIVIHVPETVKHVHHHITKKVPLPIVVFTKNPKEPKPHKEYHKEPYIFEHKEPYYHEHKEPHYHEHKEPYYHEPKETYHHEHKEPYYHEPKETYHHEHREPYYHEHKEPYHEPKEQYHNEHKEPYYHEPKEPYYHHESKETYYHDSKKPYYHDHKSSYENEQDAEFEAEYEGSEHNYVSRGLRDSDLQMARGVVADYHEVKPKVLKPISGTPLFHLTPPRRSKSTKTYDQYWNENKEEYNYGSFKAYNPPSHQPSSLGQPGGKNHQYFNIGPPPAHDPGRSVAHAFPTKVDHSFPTKITAKKNKSKEKSKVYKRRIPHSLNHDYEPRGGPSRTANQTAYNVNEFIEEDFRR